MSIYAKVIEDSINSQGRRLTTIEANIHRFVLAELNTHRAFSRNSASSRAIPVQKQLDKVMDDPAYFSVWASEQPGMSGGKELYGTDLEDARFLYTKLMMFTLNSVQIYIDRHPEPEHRLHKSLLNRFLEPFMWHRVIISATEWENFYSQRCHPDAMPEFRIAADAIREAISNSIPAHLENGDWHTPYINTQERYEWPLRYRCMVSVGRCARVSYLTHDGKRNPDEDVRLYERLMQAEPPHWSPLEHVATPANLDGYSGNFIGWEQLRHHPLPEYKYTDDDTIGYVGGL